MQESDFAWIKDRIDDLQKKWREDSDNASQERIRLTTALEQILKVERDDKGNHFEVIRTIAADALEYHGW